MNFSSAFAKRSAPVGIGGIVAAEQSGYAESSELVVLSDCIVNDVTRKPLYRPYLARQYRRELDAVTGVQVEGPLTLHPTALGWYIGESTGLAKVTFTGSSGASYVGYINVAAAAKTQTLSAWTSGFAYQCASAIDSRLAAAGAFATSKSLMFSTQDHASGTYVRNPSLWASGIDFTGCSPWNSVDQYHRAGTLVSPRHFLHAAHYAIPVGTTMRFVDAVGTVVERTVTGSASVSGTDIQVGTLDSDVPSSIKWYKVLPANWTEFAPNYRFGIPGLTLDQEEKVLTWSTGPCSASIQNYGPLSALEAPWTETLVVGDSGNPAFLAPGGELVLVTTHLTPNGGPNISQYIPQINALMGGGYSLTAYAHR